MSSSQMRNLMNLTESVNGNDVTYFMNYADDGSIVAYPNEAIGRHIEDFCHMGHTSVYANTPIMPISYEKAVEEVGGEENLPEPIPQDVISQIENMIDNWDEESDLDEVQDHIQEIIAEYTWFPD